jgi:outer membrane receptor for ferrienterochelin and colicins
MGKFYFFLFSTLVPSFALCQTGIIHGRITSSGKPLEAATVKLLKSSKSTLTDSAGYFKLENVSRGELVLHASNVGYKHSTQIVRLTSDTAEVNLDLVSNKVDLNEIVVTGTLKEVRRMESPVPVEVYTPTFFKKNPTPNIFDALQNVNGVRPQLNCNVCNTGDIHINGLEGPYTMVLIDGMPIVSSLSTVYGLSGIPNSLVERIEIVKGPASSLYGSEAVGGLINIITKKPGNAPAFSMDVMSTSWRELSTDIGFKLGRADKALSLTGISYFKYGNVVDNNQDRFTDVTLQDRISVFQKWNFARKQNRMFTLAGRYYYEDRWGGDIRWNKSFRGGDSIYGESIYTKRYELLGTYQLPFTEKFLLSFSFNDHKQDSRYGTTSYVAEQQISFAQLTWDKSIKSHDLLAGAALRYTYYDDNTVGTATFGKNMPQRTWLPGVFVQDEISLAKKHKLLLGLRYDYNSVHGSILTPRVAYKYSIDDNTIVRLNAGQGFRVVNLFTEDHAALTGSRKVEIVQKLKPEKSYNGNLNILKKFYTSSGNFIGVDLTAWYTWFNNRIIADFNTDPDKIVYDNLNGHAVSKGLSLNVDMNFLSSLKVMLGATLQDVASFEGGKKEYQLLTEKYAATWSVSYKIRSAGIALDYTGNLYGPMKLPVLGPLDPRRDESPAWSLQNIQLTYEKIKSLEIYGGLKNLFNWTPNRNNPFIIARTHDPFDRQVEYDADGQIKATPLNPYALSFDPTYLYAPNQGIRFFLGVRLNVK